MAVTKLLHMKQAKTGYPAKHLANGLKYIMDPDKTENGRYVNGNNCIAENALQQMLDTKRHFGKMDKRQGYHFIISFEEEDISEETAFTVVGEFVKEYLGPDFEAVYAIHNDTDHIHGHIIFNSVRCSNGYKYDYRNGVWDRVIQPLVNRLCEKHGLSILNLEEVQEKRKQKREGMFVEESGNKRGKTHSKRDERIKKDVDTAIEDADTYEEFLEILQDMGYEIHGKKHLAVREIGAERARRIDRFGEDYSEEMLRCRIERPPVPGIKETVWEGEILSVFIPYRKRHLTRYQKQSFVRRYRAGKPHADTNTWKYKASLQALKKLQEEYDFWDRHGITSKSQLEELSISFAKQLLNLKEEKQEIKKEKLPYLAVLNLLNELEEAQMEAGLYLEGYGEFLEEYQHYKKLEKDLEGLRYTLSDARKIETFFQAKEEALINRQRRLRKEKQTADRLIEKVYLLKEEKLTKQIEEEGRNGRKGRNPLERSK